MDAASCFIESEIARAARHGIVVRFPGKVKIDNEQFLITCSRREGDLTHFEFARDESQLTHAIDALIGDCELLDAVR